MSVLLGTSLLLLSLLCVPCTPLYNRIWQADAALSAGLLPSLKGKGSIAKGEQLYSLTGTTGSLMYMAPEVISPPISIAHSTTGHLASHASLYSAGRSGQQSVHHVALLQATLVSRNA